MNKKTINNLDIGTQTMPHTAEEVYALISNLPDREYTNQEINEARGELSFMHNRVFMSLFSGNKNNHIITGIVNALRKVHGLADIPPIERTEVQKVSIMDVLRRGMIGDLFSEGLSINVTLEAQQAPQKGYAVRGILTSANAMREQFYPGEDYTEAPDVISVNILGFRLPELQHRKMFYSRIIRTEYESGKPFLAEKYSDYHIELPKLSSFKKEILPPELHELWELCCIMKAKVKKYEEVIRMQSVKSEIALELSNEVRKTVKPNKFVKRALSQKDEIEELRMYMQSITQKAAEEAAQSAAQKGMEKMLISAIQKLAPAEIIEAMRQSAGITEIRLAELTKQTKMAKN